MTEISEGTVGAQRSTVKPVEENLDDKRPSRKSGPRLWWGVAFGVFVAASILIWVVFAPGRKEVRSLPGSDVVDVPPLGTAAAATLADGRPVFVVYHEDDTISVVDASSTHVTFGIGKLVGWCPSSRTFEDPFHGSKWDEFGDYALGPAPTGLVTYEFSVVQGLLAKVHVDGPIRSHPRGFQTHPLRAVGPFCQSTSRMVLPDVLQGASSSPADVVAAAPAGWVAVRGTLLVTAGQPARLCGAIADGACVDGALVSGVDVTGVVSRLRGPGTTVSIGGPWIAQVQAGALVHITRVPRAP